MRTSLNEIAQIDEYLMGNLTPEDSVLFQANVLLNKGLADNVNLQQKAHELIRVYGREQLKLEIKTVQRKLFTEPEHATFRQRIMRMFFPR